MKLYNSFGEIVESSTIDGKLYKNLEPLLQERFDEVENYIEEKQKKNELSKDIIMEYLPESLSIRVMEEKRIHEGLMDEDRVVGFMFLVNPVDARICGVDYFSTTKERLNNNDYGIRMNLSHTFSPSWRDMENFPDFEKLFNNIYQDFSLDDMDGFSYAKNSLLIMMQIKPPDSSSYMWEQYNTIKSNLADRCVYKKLPSHATKIEFQLNKDGETVSDCVYATDKWLVYKGNFYHNAKEFIEDYKKGYEYDFFRYGDDKRFENYLSTNELMEDIKEESLEEEAEIER